MDNARGEFTIAGDGARLTVYVLGYERSNAQNHNDANWLACIVHVELGTVSARLGTGLQTWDIASFQTQLAAVRTTLQGEAVLESVESTLRCEIQMQRGRAVIRGNCGCCGACEVELSFEFSSDQSYLARTYRELEDVVRSFPIRN